MCHFINATLPRQANVERVRAIAEQHARALEEIDSGRVTRLLNRGERYFNTTPGMCDCGTVIGSAAGLDLSNRARNFRDQTEQDDGLDHNDPEVKRLLKKGWSEAKIERSLAQRRAHAVRVGDLRRMDARDRIHHAEPWMNFLHMVLAVERASPSIGLMLIWSDYEGGDPIPRERQSLANTRPEFLLTIEENKIYDFIA